METGTKVGIAMIAFFFIFILIFGTSKPNDQDEAAVNFVISSIGAAFLSVAIFLII